MSTAGQDLLSEFLDDTGQFKREAFPVKKAEVLPVEQNATAEEQLSSDSEAQAEAESHEQNGTAIDDLQARSRIAARSAIRTAQQVQDWLAKQPTPGGIMPLLLAIALFLFAIVPVSGQGMTRLQLLYYTILGRAHLIGERFPYASGGSGGGQSWNDQGGVQQQSYQAAPVATSFQDIYKNGTSPYSGIVDFNNLS